MPLLQFHYSGEEFKFSESYSLERFDSARDIPENAKPGLSDIEFSYLCQQDWALVATNPKDCFKEELNMLLISFRIYAKSDAFIKWRFYTEGPKCSACIDDRFRNLLVIQDFVTTEEALDIAKNGFLEILKMYNVADRTKSALYFIWRGLCAEKHIDAYIFLVCAIEALFSGETAEKVTKTVIERTQKFLADINGFSGNQISKLYKIRSDMVHGRISHTDKKNAAKRRKNLNNLKNLEELIFACMKNMIENKTYLKYANVDEKEVYLSNL